VPERSQVTVNLAALFDGDEAGINPRGTVIPFPSTGQQGKLAETVRKVLENIASSPPLPARVEAHY
jgi:hypothetical protein